jgi:hypothetical protein
MDTLVQLPYLHLPTPQKSVPFPQLLEAPLQLPHFPPQMSLLVDRPHLPSMECSVGLLTLQRPLTQVPGAQSTLRSELV